MRRASLALGFAAAGIHCRTFDWPGHGRSEGQRGHMDSLETVTGLIREQRHRLRESIGPDKPIGLLGHSMGGFFALYFLGRVSGPRSSSPGSARP